jgi:fibronectin-binding autotransporter adhesin
MRMKPRFAVLLATCLLAAVRIVTGASYSWNVSSGDWSAASNWSPNGVPGAADTAIISNGGTVTVSADTSVSSLNLTSGTLAGTAALTVGSGFNWTGGTVTGTGTLTLLETVNGTITGSSTKTLDGGRVLNNQGMLVWTGTGNFHLLNGTFTVASGGLFDIQTDADLADNNSSGTSTLLVNGTLRKSAASGTTTLGSHFGSGGDVVVTLNPGGMIQIQAGVLSFIGGGGSAAGTFDTSSGARVEWNTAFTLDTGTVIQGAGVARNNSALTVAGASVVAGTGTLELPTGTLNGDGALTISGALNWTGGTMSGAGATDVAAGGVLNLAGAAVKSLSGRPLNVAGTVAWTGGNFHHLQGVVTVLPGGLWNIQTDDDWRDNDTAGTSTVVVSGILRKSAGTATTGIGSHFGSGGNVTTTVNEGGAVEVQTGTLQFDGPFNNNGLADANDRLLVVNAGGVSGGAFNADAGGAVNYSSGTQVLTNGAALTGMGTNRVSGGTFTVNADVSASHLDMSSGTLNGTNILTINGGMTWSGGTLSGTGSTSLAAESILVMHTTATKTLNGRALNVAGTVAWTGGNFHHLQGVVNVLPGGLWDIQTDDDWRDNDTAGTSLVVVSGTLRKSAGTATTALGSHFGSGGNMTTTVNEGGNVEVQTGTLQFDGPFNNNGTGSAASGATLNLQASGTYAGTFQATATGIISFNGGTHTLTNNSHFVGYGTNRVAGATVTVETALGAERLEISSGTVNGAGTVTVTNVLLWTGGTMSGTGATDLAAGGVLNLVGAAVKSLSGRPLNVAGTVAWTGGNFHHLQGVVTVLPGGLWNIQTDDDWRDNDNLGTSTVVVSGILRKSAGTATTGIGSHFGSGGNVTTTVNEGGTVEVQTGTLQFDGSLTNNGTAEVLSGILAVPANYNMTGTSVHRFGIGGMSTGAGYGRLQISGAATLAGTVEAVLVNGFNPAAGNTFLVVTFTSRTGAVDSFTGPPGVFNMQHYLTAVALRTLGAATFTWKGAIAGWGDHTQWTPEGVPGEGDTANVGAGSAAIGPTTVSTLNLSGGAVSGIGPLTVTETFNWTGGNREGPGLTVVPPAAVLNLSGSGTKGFFFHTLENSGTINWDGAGTWSGHSSPVLSNLVGGVINILGDAAMTRFNNPAIIHNAGLIRKNGGTGTQMLNVALSNTGTLEVNSGRLEITDGFTNRHEVAVGAGGELVISQNAGTSSGQFQIGAGGLVSYLSGNQALETNAVINGEGLLSVGGTARLAMNGTVSVQNLQLVTGGTISGSGPLNIGGAFNWTGGNREGPGVTAVQAGAQLNISGSGTKGFYYHTLENSGTINWDGTGAWSGHTGPVLSNLAGGVINLLSDAPLTRFNSSAVIHNAGLIRKTGGAGVQTMDVVFTNSGTLDIRTGVLSIVNSYTPTATSTHRFAVGGHDVGTGYGRLTASGAVALAGALDLMLGDGFTPTNNATFAVVTVGARTGTFSSVTGRGIGGGLYFNPVYSSTAVTLTVADGTPMIAANSAAWVDGNFQFRLHGVASESYRIDATTNLVDWTAISTNAIPGSAFMDFVDHDAPTFPHRFYRAVFLP